MVRVAVIGGGVAGMGAAKVLLEAGLDVWILEAGPQLGGNCFAGAVRGSDGKEHAFDVGVSDFNRTTFRAVSRLIDQLGLKTQAISQDADFRAPDGRLRMSCRDGRWWFEDSVEDPAALLAEMTTFRRRAGEVLTDPKFAGWSVGRYLDHLGASRALRDLYVLPRAMGCFPLADRAPDQQSVLGLVAFWNAHGLVGSAPSDRHCVVGGMHRYAAAFEQWLRDRGACISIRTRVERLHRDAQGVEVCASDSEGRALRVRVDQVVLAGHAFESAALLADATAEEEGALGRFRCQRARLVVHQDEGVFGQDLGPSGAFHYVVPEGGSPKVRPTITFHPNCLARLPSEVPDVFVAMNPCREPRADRVLIERSVLHPIFDATTPAALPAVERLQGERRTWYAGAYLSLPGVHESALQTGLRAGASLVERLRQERRLRRAGASPAPGARAVASSVPGGPARRARGTGFPRAQRATPSSTSRSRTACAKRP